MPIQTIDFNNTDSVSFNGQAVDEVILDSQSIWTGTWGSLTVGARSFFAGKTDQSVLGYAKGGLFPGYDEYGSITPMFYKGAEIVGIEAYVTFQPPQYLFNFIIKGSHPRNLFNTVTINGYTFHSNHTSSTTPFEVVTNSYPYTITLWRWEHQWPLSLADIGTVVDVEFT